MDTEKHFLLIHNDYHTTWVGLFCGLFCPVRIDSAVCDNKTISKALLSTMEMLLSRNKISLKDISFIAVNQGPGPFTTLRVIIASINGIAYATNIPLIGVNSLKTLTYEHADAQYSLIIALANAFCDDVYYGMLETKNQAYSQGYMKFESMLLLVQSFNCASIKFVGLISEEQKNKLMTYASTDSASKRSYFENCSGIASLEAMGNQAAAQWRCQENKEEKLLPLYFKSSEPTIKMAQ